MYAPVNWLEAAVYVALFRELAKYFDDRGLILAAHCQVRLVPVSQSAEAFELFLLDINPLRGVIAARQAHLEYRGRDAFLAEIARYLVLDRKSVVVPSGNVGRPVAPHRLVADNEVFQQLIQSVADVNVAVGVGRPIVQDKQTPGGRSGYQLVVDISLFPLFLYFRLPVWQVGLHRKRGIRQVYCLAVVHS